MFTVNSPVGLPENYPGVVLSKISAANMAVDKHVKVTIDGNFLIFAFTLSRRTKLCFRTA